MPAETKLSSPVVSADNWGIYLPEEGGKRWILKGLNLRIGRGEKVLLTGPSGSGKSTLLYALAGINKFNGDRSEEGNLKVSGTRTVGLVQQDPEAGLILDRADINVAFGPENCAVPLPQLRSRVTDSLDTVGLQIPAGRRTEKLSGGQKQRLAIAGVVAMEPELMLLDEPTAHLDAQGAEGVRDAALQAAAKNNATLVVAEHHLAVWYEYVDRMVVLSRSGEIIADGTPEEVAGDRSGYLQKHGVWVPGYVPEAQKIMVGHSMQVESAVTLQTVGLGVSRAAGLPKDPVTPWGRRRYRHKLRRVPQVLRDVGFSAGNDVPGRNVMCISGRNGTGKTSLALTCASLLAAAAGKVTLKVGDTDVGLDAMSVSDLPYYSGMVLQEPEHQFVARTVAGEIRHGLASSGARKLPTPEQEELYGFLVSRLSLSHCQYQNPYTLSGGEKRRLALAAVLAARPRVLVLDEPTSGQDSLTWRQIVGLCLGLADAGLILIVVSHDKLLRAKLLEYGATEYLLDGRSCPAPSCGSEAGGQKDSGRNGSINRLSFLQSLNPLTKITMTALFSATAMISRDWLTAGILIAIQLVLLPLSGMRLKTALLVGGPLVSAAAASWFGTAIMVDPGGGAVVHWGWYTVAEDAPVVATAVTARMLAVALSGCCLMAAMDGYAVGAALARWTKTPQDFVFGALAAMRLFGSLAIVWDTLSMGRRSRGLKPGIIPQLVPFLVAIIRQGLRVADSMEALGMRPEAVGRPSRRTWLRPSVLSRRDAASVFCSGMACFGAVAVSASVGLWQPLWGG